MKKLSSLISIFLFAGMALRGQETETLFGKSGLRFTGLWGSLMAGLTAFDKEVVPVHGVAVDFIDGARPFKMNCRVLW